MMWWHAQLPPVGRRVKESPQPHLLMVCDKSPESCALGGSLTAVHRVLEITSFFTYIKYIDKSAVAFCYHDCYVRRVKERQMLP